MGIAIKLMRLAGLKLADFRHKTPAERADMWMLVAANAEWSMH